MREPNFHTNIGQIFSYLRQVFTPEQTQALIQSFGFLESLPSHTHNNISNYSYLSREQLRELDHLAIEQYGIPGIVLMENAGSKAANIIASMTSGPVVILCGKGNNGGDGFVLARYLHNWGIPFTVLLIGNSSQISLDTEAGINMQILQRMKIPIYEVSDLATLKSTWPTNPEPEIIVDAMFGTGLNGIVREPFLNIIQEIPKYKKPIIALDTPSGLDANTGDILGAAIPAILTITFAYPKKGFLFKYGPKYVGKVVVVDIGIPKELLEQLNNTRKLINQLGNI